MTLRNFLRKNLQSYLELMGKGDIIRGLKLQKMRIRRIFSGEKTI